MLSGESAVGAYLLEAVKMLARIATEVEPEAQFVNYPPDRSDDTHAISEALHVIDQTLPLQCIVAFTETDYTAKLAAEERPSVPVVAFTSNPKVYRQMNLVWGLRPVLLEHPEQTLEALLLQIENCLLQRHFATTGDKILVIGGIPMGKAGSTNFFKIHTIASRHDPVNQKRSV